MLDNGKTSQLFHVFFHPSTWATALVLLGPQNMEEPLKAAIILYIKHEVKVITNLKHTHIITRCRSVSILMPNSKRVEGFLRVRIHTRH